MKKFLIFLLIFVVILFLHIFHLKKKVNAYVKIPKGKSINEIASLLKKKDVISSKYLFLIYSKIRNKSLKAGYYEFEGKYSISDVWYKLYKGKEKLLKVIVVPGDDLFSVANKLDKKGIINKKKFLNFAFNRNKLSNIGIHKNSFEGYIYPDTYLFSAGTKEEKIFKVFINRFKEEYRSFNINSKNFYRFMIIASLIEKETTNFREKRIISGIIYKRLKIRMPIQIDASLIYGMKIKNIPVHKLTKKDYKLLSIYNTYKNYGLPPTPICNFSKESFLAAVNPENTEYLYYFSKDGKKHIFSKTYKEHLNKLKQW